MSLTRPIVRPILRPVLRSVFDVGVGGGGALQFPETIYRNGEPGAVFDFADIGTLYTDSARTSPVAAVGSKLGSASDLSGNGHHAGQATAGSRPEWNGDGAVFDGVATFLQSPAIDFTTTDEVTIVAYVTKASDAAIGVVVEHDSSASNGFMLRGPGTNGIANYSLTSRGTAQAVSATLPDHPAPATDVVTCRAKIATDLCQIRVDGGAWRESAQDQGDGTYRNAGLTLGRRSIVAQNLFNGVIHRIIVVGRLLTDGELAEAEAWVSRPFPDAPSEYSPEGYWVPPVQPANVAGKDWTTAEIIAKYDTLAAAEPRLTKHRYEDDLGAPILTDTGYELFHYLYEPTGYDKTIFMQAQIHGNEKDSRLTLYRMMEILFTLRETPGYTAWQRVYDRCRLIVIPVISPYGNDTGSGQIPYKDATFGMNPNRNFDYNHQYATTAAGVGGDQPFDVAEVRHTRDVVTQYGPETIDLAIDYHDGGGVPQHYWIDYVVDAPNRPLVNAFVEYLMQKYGVDPNEAVIPNVKDTEITGATSRWFGRSMGVTTSTNEWMGGIFGYTFDSEHLTHSLDIRSNMLFMALDNDLRAWQVREPEGASFFHFDFPRAFTRNSLRMEGSSAETKVSDASIYARWDALQAEHPALISKSAVLGQNAHGMDVHTYTFGDGQKKVLFVGGVMRFGGTRRIDEYAAYQLVEYLCDDYIVNQSAFLTDLRDNYTIIVLPFIDNIAGNAEFLREAGLNNTAVSRQRWVIDAGSDKTVPAPNANGTGNHGVQIIKALIDANTDLACIVSGGEWMGGYALNPPDYATEFQTHFVVPRNMAFDRSDYATHLTENRGEHVVVENSKGFTFGDYAFDQHGIPAYFVQLQVSDRFADLAAHHTLTADQYLHSNYEAGRRMANIANLFIGPPS